MFPKIVTGEHLQLHVLEVTDENATLLKDALSKSEKHRSKYLKQFWDYKSESSVKRQLASRQMNFLHDKGVFYGIFETKSNTLIGEVAFLRENNGYNSTLWIDENFTGRGYMQEALSLSEEAFFSSGHDKIIGYVRSSNGASRHVLEKRGYTAAGKDSGYLIYQKKRADYLKKR